MSSFDRQQQHTRLAEFPQAQQPRKGSIVLDIGARITKVGVVGGVSLAHAFFTPTHVAAALRYSTDRQEIKFAIHEYMIYVCNTVSDQILLFSSTSSRKQQQQQQQAGAEQQQQQQGQGGDVGGGAPPVVLLVNACYNPHFYALVHEYLDQNFFNLASVRQHAFDTCVVEPQQQEAGSSCHDDGDDGTTSNSAYTGQHALRIGYVRHEENLCQLADERLGRAQRDRELVVKGLRQRDAAMGNGGGGTGDRLLQEEGSGAGPQPSALAARRQSSSTLRRHKEASGTGAENNNNNDNNNKDPSVDFAIAQAMRCDVKHTTCPTHVRRMNTQLCALFCAGVISGTVLDIGFASTRCVPVLREVALGPTHCGHTTRSFEGCLRHARLLSLAMCQGLQRVIFGSAWRHQQLAGTAITQQQHEQTVQAMPFIAHLDALRLDVELTEEQHALLRSILSDALLEDLMVKHGYFLPPRCARSPPLESGEGTRVSLEDLASAGILDHSDTTLLHADVGIQTHDVPDSIDGPIFVYLAEALEYFFVNVTYFAAASRGDRERAEQALYTHRYGSSLHETVLDTLTNKVHGLTQLPIVAQHIVCCGSIADVPNFRLRLSWELFAAASQVSAASRNEAQKAVAKYVAARMRLHDDVLLHGNAIVEPQDAAEEQKEGGKEASASEREQDEEEQRTAKVAPEHRVGHKMCHGSVAYPVIGAMAAAMYNTVC